MAAGKETGAMLPAPIPKLTGLALDNSGSGFAQGFAHAIPVRRCVRCGVRVENPNLGGHGRAAGLFGPLWCLWCADGGRGS
jgi:hypothetical protein